MLRALKAAHVQCENMCRAGTWRRYSTHTKASPLFDMAMQEMKQTAVREVKATAARTIDGKLVKGQQKLNMLARQIKGLSLVDAMAQMKFSLKKPAIRIAATLQRSLNETRQANIGNDRKRGRGLFIAQAWVGKDIYKHGINIMGRGRFGILTSPRSHMKILLQESDVPLAPNRGNKYQGKGGFVAPRQKPKKVEMILPNKPIYNKWKKLFYDA